MKNIKQLFTVVIILSLTIFMTACQELVLTVENGEGSGNYYPGTKVNIKANPAPEGQRFYKWEGVDVARVNQIYEPSTYITTWIRNTTITAVFIPSSETYKLEVKNGSGEGEFHPGELVNIKANTPPDGERFKSWLGDNTANIGSVKNKETTFRMPRKNSYVEASFDHSFILEIEDGSGSGEFFEGDAVTIKGDTPPKPEFHFGAWEGDIEYLQDVKNQTQTFKMPAKDVRLQATYVEEYEYECEAVLTGTDDGFFSLEVFKNKLFAGGFGYNRKPGLFTLPDAKTVSPGLVVGESVCEMREFKGNLYANTENQGILYRSADGVNWTKVLDDSNDVGCVLREYKGYLYATSYGFGTGNGKIYRSADGINWQVVFDSGNVHQLMKELIEYNGVLYAFSLNKTLGQGGFFTTTNGTNWQWNSFGSTRPFKGYVWKNKLWISTANYFAQGSSTGIWSYDGQNYEESIKLQGKSHVGEMLDHDGNLFATVTVEWKGKQGGASVIMSKDVGKTWETVCSFPETESWNLAAYNNDLYVTTKQDGGGGRLGKVYKIKRK